MLGTISFVEKAMWAVTIVFSIAAVLLISTTVRLSIFARRREIEIMQLVGATRWFIRWPFILEGFFTGLVGSLLAAFTVWGLNFFVNDWIEKSLDFLDPAAYRRDAVERHLAARRRPDARPARLRARRRRARRSRLRRYLHV